MRRGLVVLFAAVLLGGCTDADWDHTLSYVGLDSGAPPPAAAPAAVAAATPAESAENSWCVEAAKAAQREAAEQGFDSATQHYRAQVTYRQCVTEPGVSPQ